ncbi:hypothetical protein KJ903_01550 [Patescibacteria group bacterium]|nr:hypothetical protein [Patescibacteria group bacterium]
MNNYQKQQHQVFEQLEKEVRAGKTTVTLVETMDNYATDQRLCLTSVVFLPPELQKIVTDKIIAPLKQADSRQYYYPPASLHITIQSIRTVPANFPPRFTAGDIVKVKKVFQQVVVEFRPFTFELRGLLEMPTSIAIRAYSDKILGNLALELRKRLAEAGVPDNKQYISPDIVFGNLTVCRYTTEPNDNFKTNIAELKTADWGELEVRKINLITTNAVCHPDKTKILATYNLK